MIPGTVELAGADRALWSLLGDDEALGALIGPGNVYAHVAPPELDGDQAGLELAGTFVVWSLIAPLADVGVLGTGPASRVLVRAEYAVKAVGPVTAPLDLEPVASRVDALLAGAELALDGYTWTVARVAPILFPEVLAEGPLHWHVGGLYRLETG